MNIRSAKDILSRYLKERKLRLTRERFLLFQQIMHTNKHFDADELYASLRSKGLKSSRATVYNTLDLFLECGLISKYRFDERHTHYEKALGRPRHDHLICLKCGDIIEFVHDKLDTIQREVCEENKFEPHNSTMQIFGICCKCKSKKK